VGRSIVINRFTSAAYLVEGIHAALAADAAGIVLRVLRLCKRVAFGIGDEPVEPGVLQRVVGRIILRRSAEHAHGIGFAVAVLGRAAQRIEIILVISGIAAGAVQPHIEILRIADDRTDRGRRQYLYGGPSLVIIKIFCYQHGIGGIILGNGLPSTKTAV